MGQPFMPPTRNMGELVGKDRRTFIKLHDGYADHDRVIDLTDAAFRMHVSAMCFCGSNQTDGRIKARVLLRYAGRKAIDELVAAGLLVETADGYEVHDYLDYNRSRAEIEELSAKRAEAGNKGGRPRKQPGSKPEAKRNQNGLQTETKAQSQKNPDTDTDTDTEVNGPVSYHPSALSSEDRQVVTA